MVHIKLCVSSNVVFGLFLLSNIAIHKSATWLKWDFRPKKPYKRTENKMKKKFIKPNQRKKSNWKYGKRDKKKVKLRQKKMFK